VSETRTIETGAPDAAPGQVARRIHRLRWWREVLLILGFYGVYSVIRNQFGSAAVSPQEAFANARDVIGFERFVGLYHEETLQEWFLDSRWFIQFWNLFYGTFHFVVTAGCVIWLFRRFPHQYVRWRTTLACTTALALFGFALYPLMPPRLLPGSYSFVDTLRDYGGLWSFDSGAMQKVSNQYAAMPSLHFAWSTWCALVIVPRARRWWVKALAAAYPAATVFAIIVTGNHYWLDALGGAVILAVGAGCGWWWAARGPGSEVLPETAPG
jgi:membrane-associated phospholipid phosphatase